MDLSLQHQVIADGEVHFVGVELIEQLRRVEIGKPQMNAGRDLAHARQQRRHDQDFHAVRQSEPECSHRRCRIEGLFARHQRLDLRQHGPHRLEQRHRARGEAHALGAACEKFVTEQLAQPREVVTHRGLADADAAGGARHAPLAKQRIEMNEEIEVDTT